MAALVGALPGTVASAESAVDCLPLLHWEQARVDRSGDLWILTERGTAILRVGRDGQPQRRIELSGARSFDADSEWGVVALDRLGRELRWWTGSSAKPLVQSLPWEAAHVAWVDASWVAVSTTTASDAVVLFEPATGRTRSVLIGGETEIHPAPGATLLRSWFLAGDPERERLAVLDSLTGELRIVSLDGRTIGRAQARAHRLPAILEWLEGVDGQARAADRAQTPLYVVLRVGIDPAGDPWLVERCSEDRESATLARFVDATLERRELRLPGPHCSLNFVPWGERIVFARSGSPVSWHCDNPWRADQNEDGTER